jgi:hypothetical protein
MAAPDVLCIDGCQKMRDLTCITDILPTGFHGAVNVLGKPEVDCGIDCAGFEGQEWRPGGQIVKAPAAVLNSLMEITRPPGSIGIPGLYVTEDPGSRMKR